VVSPGALAHDKQTGNLGPLERASADKFLGACHVRNSKGSTFLLARFSTTAHSITHYIDTAIETFSHPATNPQAKEKVIIDPLPGEVFPPSIPEAAMALSELKRGITSLGNCLFDDQGTSEGTLGRLFNRPTDSTEKLRRPVSPQRHPTPTKSLLPA